MTIKNKRRFNLIIVAILMILFFNVLSLINFYETGQVYAEEPSETETGVPDTTSGDTTNTTIGLMPAIRKVVSQWYYIFRYFSIVAMLIVLIYLGIQLAITASASDKAKYKRMLMDWVVGFVIIFCIHYFMVLVLNLNSACLDAIESIRNRILLNLANNSDDLVSSQGLYETIRTRAYELRVGIGTSGMIMYMVLVYYTIRFIIIYFKRFFTMMILTIIAPLVGLSYAFTKVMTGKAPIIKKWAEEYCFNVFLQTIHVLIYTVFVTMALVLSTESIAGFIVALIMLNFMLKADKIFRKIFKFSGNLLDDNADKDMKENFAALTAVKASAATVLGGQMAKDTANNIKKGIGAISNVGLYAGLATYDKILQHGEKNDKDYQKLKELKEDVKNATTPDKKAKAEAKLQHAINTTEKLARMEKRRDRLSKYKETDHKAVEQETNRRIKEEEKMAKQLGKPPVTEERKREIEKEVTEKHKNKIKRRYVELNKLTGEYEVKSGIASTLKTHINNTIWGNNTIKNATKNLVKGTANHIIGSAMIFAAIPLTVSNPTVGLALLGKGLNKTKSHNGLRQNTTLAERRRLKKAKKETLKKQKLSFNRFNVTALKTIQASERMEKEANIIRKINAPGIALGVFTMPLKLTGAMGAIRNIMANQYKVDKAKKKYYQNKEASYAVARKGSVTQDYMALYYNCVEEMEDNYSNMSLEEAVMENKEATGSVYDVNGTKLEFKGNNISSLTDSALIDNAILKVAAINNIVDLNEVNFKNKVFQSQAIKELSNLGLLENPDVLSVDEPTKELIMLMKKMEDRKKVLARKTPEAAKEKLVQIVISGYMQENEIDNPEEIKTSEHAEKIKEIIDERIETGRKVTKSKEERFKQRIYDVIQGASDTANNKNDIKTKIEEILVEENLEKLLVKKEKIEEIVEEANKTTDNENDRNAQIEGKLEKLLIEIKIEEIVEEKIETIVEEAMKTTDNENDRNAQIEENLEKLLVKKEKIEEIIEEAMKTTDNENDRNAQIEENLEKLFEKSNNPEETSGIVDELIEKKKKLGNYDFKTVFNEEKDIVLEDEPITQEDEEKNVKYEKTKISEKTRKLIDSIDIESVISSINKKHEEKIETEQFIDNIILSVQRVEDSPTLTEEEEKIISSPEEISKFIQDTARKKVVKSQEFVDLNEELRKFDSLKDVDEITEEFVEKNSSGNHDEILAYLIAGMNENKVLVDLKITKPNDERVKSMQYFDEQKRRRTYNHTNIENVINSIAVR